MNQSPQFLATALSLLLSVLSIAGLVFLTQFAFYAKPSGGKQCVKLTEKRPWAMTVTKVAVVLLWIQLVVAASSAFLAFKAPGVSGYRLSGM